MDFRGSRQALSYHDGIIELPSDVLARLMAGRLSTVEVQRRAPAARVPLLRAPGGTRRWSRGCRAALAELDGCSEAAVQQPPQPADEQWMRTAAIEFAAPMGRDDELLHLVVARFVERAARSAASRAATPRTPTR